MGQLVNGAWKDEWYDTSKTGGRFERTAAAFRNWITPDGAPGPTGKGGFLPKAGVTIFLSPMPARGRTAP